MINPGGLLGGRKNKDGVTYFTLSTAPEESNGSIYTDFALNLKIDEKKAETIHPVITRIARSIHSLVRHPLSDFCFLLLLFSLLSISSILQTPHFFRDFYRPCMYLTL